VITEARGLAHRLCVLGLVMAAFVLHSALHYEPPTTSGSSPSSAATTRTNTFRLNHNIDPAI